MTAARPFPTVQACLDSARLYWNCATEAERLEAFSGHPQIGDMQALRNKYAVSAGREQGQITSASEEVLLNLRDENKTYASKYGFIFIVCATGKAAPEMLAILRQRMRNDRATELDIAAGEQLKITELRLGQLFN